MWNSESDSEGRRPGLAREARILKPYSGYPDSIRAECQCAWRTSTDSVGGNQTSPRAVNDGKRATDDVAVTKARTPLREDLEDLISQIFDLTQERPVDVLETLHRLQEEIDHQIVETIAHARKSGLSWQQIATPLCVSKQSVWERYRLVVEG